MSFIIYENESKEAEEIEFVTKIRKICETILIFQS